MNLLKNVAKRLIGESKQLLGARWRIVIYLKGLLAEMKPKLATAKFNEVLGDFFQFLLIH